MALSLCRAILNLFPPLGAFGLYPSSEADKNSTSYVAKIKVPGVGLEASRLHTVLSLGPPSLPGSLSGAHSPTSSLPVFSYCGSSPSPCPEHLLRNQLYSSLQDITTPQTAQAKALTKPSWQLLPHSKPGDSPLTIWLVDQHPLKTVSAKHPLLAVALSLGSLPTDSVLPHSLVLSATV